MKAFRLFLVSLVLFGSCHPLPVLAEPQSFCFGLPPSCHLPFRPVCLCPATSIFSCQWECIK